MKKWWIAACCLFVLLTARGGAQAVSAAGAVVLDADTGQVLFQSGADTQLPMASTTKIMTAILALEMLDPAQEVQVKPEYTGIEGSSMYLKAGETVTVEELLYGLMLSSGNDAAVALACESAGSEEAFVAEMNRKAQQLGLTQTSFETPNGLDGPNHHTTAHELARLTAYALHNETFRQIVSTRSITFGERYMSNHNKLLRQYEGCIGVKTGYTQKSGRCLVSAAERNGRTLVAVTLNDPNDWADHREMLDAAFAQYEEVTLWEAGAVLRAIPVISGVQDQAEIVTAQPCRLFLTKEEQSQLRSSIFGEKFAYAPVTAGEEYGKIKILLGDWPIAEQPVVWRQSVAVVTPAPAPSLWERLLDVLRVRG